MDKIELDGQEWSKKDVEDIREVIIKWRDESYKQWPEAIPFTTTATHLIGFLAGVIKQYPED